MCFDSPLSCLYKQTGVETGSQFPGHSSFFVDVSPLAGFARPGENTSLGQTLSGKTKDGKLSHETHTRLQN